MFLAQLDPYRFIEPLAPLEPAVSTEPTISTFYITVLCVVWGCSALVGAIAADAKQAAYVGFFLGLIFGPLGALVAHAVDHRRLCPKCGGRLNRRPTICQHCSTALSWNLNETGWAPWTVTLQENEADVRTVADCPPEQRQEPEVIEPTPPRKEMAEIAPESQAHIQTPTQNTMAFLRWANRAVHVAVGEENTILYYFVLILGGAIVLAALIAGVWLVAR